MQNLVITEEEFNKEIKVVMEESVYGELMIIPRPKLMSCLTLLYLELILMENL